MLSRPEETKDDVRNAAATGMFAMMAMMMICCVGMLALIALIPVFGWPIGIVLAIGGGAALMYAHYKLMGHGGHHAQSPESRKGTDQQ